MAQGAVASASSTPSSFSDEKAPVMIFNDLNSEESSKGIIISTTMTSNEIVESALKKFRIEGNPAEFIFITVTERGPSVRPLPSFER